MADDTTRTPRRGGGARAAVAWVAIVGLLALVLWLVSERNARTWYLVPDEGRLVVMRGILAPLGRQTFKTADPSQAQAYEPIVAPPGKPLPAERAFEERSLLDQGIYDLLSGWAREEIASGDAARLERGLGYLSRAERLAGLSPTQREDLSALRAESGFYEAQRLLDRAVGELRDATEKLRHTGASRSARANDARALLHDVEPALDAASIALRNAASAQRSQQSGQGAQPAAQPGAPAQAAPTAPESAPAPPSGESGGEKR
ncbi:MULTISPECIES: hypothetical protein [unclassified Anaeromyxobacter]|uniref:hypothetical protein n=1 Tax=unclassified Anaeromyxobacter TaxID=2620896 RepID=UPI001F565416|nr:MULTISPECIES: hypothetical protein [unclassified Anaeromyxobacter]